MPYSIIGIEGIVYYPQDNQNKELTDELSYILLDKISTLQKLDYEVILISDFDSKCITRCEFTTTATFESFQQSYNSKRLK